MSRQRMAAFLWPDHGPGQARASLRQALSRMRDALGAAADVLQSDTSAIWLDADLCDIDTDRLEDMNSVSELTAAGEFLEGIHVAEPALQEWLEAERRIQSERLLKALQKAGEQAEQDNRHDDVIQLGHRQVTLDPLNEAAHRRLMQAFAASRRRSRALAQYDTLKSLLRAELDLAPEAETTALFNQIRADRARRPAPVEQIEPAETQPAEIDESTPELRLITVLCIHADPEPTSYAEIREAIVGCGGTPLSEAANEVLFAFGLRQSREDDARRALEAALKLRSVDPTFSVGLSLGLVTVDPTGVRGAAFRRAESLAYLAMPGEILAGRFFRNQAQDWARFEEENIRGQTVWRVIDMGEGAMRPHLPLVGRKIEMLQMTELMRQAEEADGSVVILAGDAGIGKTRLTEEVETAARQSGYPVVRFSFSLTTENRTLLDLRLGRSLAAALGLKSIPEHGGLSDLVREFLTAVFDPGRERTVLSRLYGIGRETVVELSAEALVYLVTAHRNAVVTLILEDCHWAENEEIALACAVARRLHGKRAWLLATERPAEERLRPAIGLAAMETPLHVMMLPPLRTSEAHALARQVLPSQHEREDEIVDKAAGSPLFIIRLAQANDELGKDMPTSVIALAQQQLDSISPQARASCQNAAVLGHRFSQPEAAAIFGPSMTSDLIGTGFFGFSGNNIEFIHALIHQAVYETMPQASREQAHLQAARFYQSRDVTKWADHALLSGDQALAATACAKAAFTLAPLGSFDRAERFIDAGLAVGGTEIARAQLLSYRGSIRREQGHFDEARALYAEAAETTDITDPRAQALVRLAWVHRFQGDTESAQRAIDAATELMDTGEPSAVTRADYLIEMGNRAFMRGDHRQAMKLQTKALRIAEGGRHFYEAARALSGQGDAHYANFRLISAREKFRQAIEIAEHHGYGLAANASRHMYGLTNFYVEPGEKSRELSRIAIDRARLESSARNEYTARIDYYEQLLFNIELDRAAKELCAIEELSAKIGSNRFDEDLAASQCALAVLVGDLETVLRITGYYLQQPPSPYIWPCFAALRAAGTTDTAERDKLLAQGEEVLAKTNMSHSVIYFYYLAAIAMRKDPVQQERYATTLLARADSEVTGIVELITRSMRARANPDPEVQSQLRGDLETARLRGLYPELFPELVPQPL
ncbi:BTAD domain-containing putative transcriptional regulator [Oricola sp.]|uniref:BTAD domain-containing putative transcriptional regulator n=1 Tax=Oricola sp. TaxID=1979950 RepID=UPI003BAB773B